MINSFFLGITFLIFQFSILYQSVNHDFNQNINKLDKENIEVTKDDNPVVSPQNILFVVKHSQSTNVVVYQANRTLQKCLDDKKPVDVFWLMNTKGKTTENLTAIEWKLAFGFKITQLVKGKKYKITLNAIKNKEIIIEQDNDGKVVSFMTLNGQYSKLKDVFIKFEHTFGFPDVKYVELSGYSVKNDKLTAERVWSD